MKVYIHNGSRQYQHLFESLGFEVVAEKLSELVVFTGGSDVSPDLYGQSLHPYSQVDEGRDEDDVQCYLRNVYKPKVGICRGAQFLHVMNGGQLFQDVDNHAISTTHKLIDLGSDQEWEVTSTHHQMMAPGPGVVLGVANLTTYADQCFDGDVLRQQLKHDLEVVQHPLALCFQPHPEFYGADSTKECFAHFLGRFLEDVSEDFKLGAG